MISQFLVNFTNIFCELLSFIIIIYVILEIISPRLLLKLSIIPTIAIPILTLVSKFVPKVGYIDLSPLVAIIIINIIQIFLTSLFSLIQF